MTKTSINLYSNGFGNWAAQVPSETPLELDLINLKQLKTRAQIALKRHLIELGECSTDYRIKTEIKQLHVNNSGLILSVDFTESN
jgi:hypothetical protein